MSHDNSQHRGKWLPHKYSELSFQRENMIGACTILVFHFLLPFFSYRVSTTLSKGGLSPERSQYPYSVRREWDVRLSNTASELMSLLCHTIGQYAMPTLPALTMNWQFQFKNRYHVWAGLNQVMLLHKSLSFGWNGGSWMKWPRNIAITEGCVWYGTKFSLEKLLRERNWYKLSVLNVRLRFCPINFPGWKLIRSAVWCSW